MALMKLAFLCNNMKSTNGVERVLSQRLSLLAESGKYDVYLITYNQYGEPFSFPISDKVHYIDLATRYIERCSYHGLYQYADRLFSKIIYKRSIRRCICNVNPDVITCVDIQIADLLTVLSLETCAVKIVECHCGLSAFFGGITKEGFLYKHIIKRILVERIVRTIRKFDKFVVMTDAELLDWNDDKAVRIPNMLAAYPNVATDVSITKHRVCSIGRYAYQKGFDLLIKAWAVVQEKYPDWSLHIYGSRDGDMGDYDRMIKNIDKDGLHDVFLHPATKDVYSKFFESDFYVLPSRYESFGLTIIEAMSCGLPIVSFDCKYGPSSVITAGETGILVPQNDVDKLADAICSMIKDKEMRHRMGANARLESKRYLPENIMPLWHEFYKSLGKGHSTDA